MLISLSGKENWQNKEHTSTSFEYTKANDSN